VNQDNEPLSADAVFKAPSTIIWNLRKIGILMYPRPKKDAWIQKMVGFVQIKGKEKNNSSGY
jgi:hypothetical protein